MSVRKGLKLVSIGTFAIIFCFLLGIFTIQTYAMVADYGDIVGCKVVKVYDGDTIFVNIPDTHPLFGKSIAVRIAHIDAPEMQGKCPAEVISANNARNFIKKALPASGLVNLHHVRRDKYFRILADVEIDGVNIGPELLQVGLVRPYEGEAKKSWCTGK